MDPSRYDHISLRNITTVLNIQPDPWHRENVPQPAHISVKLADPTQLVRKSAREDSVKYTLNYGELYREKLAEVARKSKHEQVVRVHELAFGVVAVCRYQLSNAKPVVPDAFWANVVDDATVDISIHLPKGVLRADGGITYNIMTRTSGMFRQKWTVHDMRCYCILGINTHERLEKQRVSISMEFSQKRGTLLSIQRMTAALAQIIADMIEQTVENSAFQTVEALAQHICDNATKDLGIYEITVSIEKLSATSMADCPIVKITRNRDDFA
ncbi:hypothetical protein KEM56_001100 [Ascosphaera pollenicola]|nr:hypothetical protein KEM56_001100 [Ascosphaera pollenicola]